MHSPEIKIVKIPVMNELNITTSEVKKTAFNNTQYVLVYGIWYALPQCKVIFSNCRCIPVLQSWYCFYRHSRWTHVFTHTVAQCGVITDTAGLEQIIIVCVYSFSQLFVQLIGLLRSHLFIAAVKYIYFRQLLTWQCDWVIVMQSVNHQLNISK